MGRDAPDYHLRFSPSRKAIDSSSTAHGIVDRNDGPRFEHKSRKHRAELVNGRRIVTVQQHIPAPVAYADHEQLDLEIALPSIA
jgi:hypothetical protein